MTRTTWQLQRRPPAGMSGVIETSAIVLVAVTGTVSGGVLGYFFGREKGHGPEAMFNDVLMGAMLGTMIGALSGALVP